MDEKDKQIEELMSEVRKYKELYLSWKFDYWDVYFGVSVKFKDHWIEVYGEDEYWEMSEQLEKDRNDALQEHAEFLINTTVSTDV